MKLVTDDGIEGVGEVYGTAFGPKTMVAAIEDIYQRYVEGMDPFHIEKPSGARPMAPATRCAPM